MIAEIVCIIVVVLGIAIAEFIDRQQDHWRDGYQLTRSLNLIGSAIALGLITWLTWRKEAVGAPLFTGAITIYLFTINAYRAWKYGKSIYVKRLHQWRDSQFDAFYASKDNKGKAELFNTARAKYGVKNGYGHINEDSAEGDKEIVIREWIINRGYPK